MRPQVAALGGLLGFAISFTSLWFISRSTATVYSLTVRDWCHGCLVYMSECTGTASRQETRVILCGVYLSAPGPNSVYCMMMGCMYPNLQQWCIPPPVLSCSTMKTSFLGHTQGSINKVIVAVHCTCTCTCIHTHSPSVISPTLIHNLYGLTLHRAP